MDKRLAGQYMALVRREIQEHRNLFVGGPVILALLLVVLLVWMLNFGSQDLLVEVLEQAGRITDGMSGLDLAPMLMPTALPFVILLYVSLLAYMVNSLYQDRRDMSILFWQSMPVSNMNTVLSKLFTACVVAPLFSIGILMVSMLFMGIVLTVLAATNGIDSVGLGQFLVATVYGGFLMYLTLLLSALWMLSTIGWLFLFSAFAKGQPLMWAIGVFVLVTLLEGLVFDTQYLANWAESRSGIMGNLVLEPSAFFVRLFSYDMLFGIALGAMVITGAVYMRRYTD